MTLEITIIPTTRDHIYELIETIRDDDRKEIEAMGITCAKGLWVSYKASFRTRTALIDGKVAAVWGVGGDLLSDTARPWLLTSYEVLKISPIAFARIYRSEVRGLLSLYSHLVNWVWADHASAIRMLEICGFKIGEIEKIGLGNFRKFEMRG